ncbi:MAG: YceI family protein [Saprospiraceae bacterium]|nr:YceI family protein [Saprospiraceae bacterium]
MKNVLLFSVLAVFAMTSATILKPTAYTVDVAKSTFQWTGKKVTGSHWGYIKFANGSVSVEKNTVVGGTFDVDMNSMDCQDLKGEYGQKLLGHLKADDFFGTDKFPKATLTLKTISPIAGAKAGENNFNVKADLTIKGQANEVDFPAMIAVSANEVTAKADFNINRTKYGIKYGSGSFFSNLGDKTIYDDFNVKINLVATK